MWERLRRFKNLGRQERGLFLRASLLLPLVVWSLRLRGYRSTLALLLWIPSKVSSERDETEIHKSAELAARAVNFADRHSLVRASCLAKSITLWWLLKRQGIQSHLRIGVRKSGESFEAHAWVEHEGIALNEFEEHHHHYAAFDESFASMPLTER